MEWRPSGWNGWPAGTRQRFAHRLGEDVGSQLVQAAPIRMFGRPPRPGLQLEHDRRIVIAQQPLKAIAQIERGAPMADEPGAVIEGRGAPVGQQAFELGTRLRGAS